MRTLDECRAEVYRVSEQKKASIRKRRKRLLFTCLPLILLTVLWSVTALPAMLPASSADPNAGNPQSGVSDGMGEHYSGDFSPENDGSHYDKTGGIEPHITQTEDTSMKKKAWIPVIAVLLLLAVLFAPISQGALDDGGTKVYRSLTYKLVKWNRVVTSGNETVIYNSTKVYFGADARKSIDELWEAEHGDCTIGDPNNGDVLDYKPVIYLYPEAETDVTVKLTYNGKLTCTYPAYKNGWRVTAAPDGTLTDANGKEYNYLYWEGITSTKYDLSHGFCVRGKDTAAFLEEALARLGLNRREANEFIVYWLPLMQENEYNLISFQGELYQNSAKLDITPTPDTLIRVFMAWQKSDTYVEIPPQELTAPDRAGFTVIEWGGTEIRGYDE